jgi:hypothetical protein
MGLLQRAPIMLGFLLLVSLAVLASDDGTLFGTGTAPLLDVLRALSSAWRRHSERFEVSRSPGPAPESKRCPPGGPAPSPLPPPDSATMSPVEFEQGRRSNPGVKLRYLEGTPPDPQRLSILLQWRTREDLWLACQARTRHHCARGDASGAAAEPAPQPEPTDDGEPSPYPPPCP